MFLTCVLPEDYRATSINRRMIGLIPNHALLRAIYIPSQDVVVSGDTEVYFRLLGLTPETLTQLGQLRIARGKYEANEPVVFTLASIALKENTVLYIEKHVSHGLLALPESLVQIECR